MAIVKTYYENGKIRNEDYYILDKASVSKVEMCNNSDDRVLLGFGHMEA